MDDLEFVQRCVKGDKKAWDELVDKYSRLIYNYIHSILNLKITRQFNQEDVHDLFQEIFYLLAKDNFKKLSSFKAKNGCSLASWLRQVVINFTLDYTRKHKNLVSLDAQDEDGFALKEIIADNSPSLIEMLSDREGVARLKDCIERLDNDDKYFLELHINNGLRLKELKDIFRISRGAIDMRKTKLINRLRQCFKNKGFQLDF